MRILFVFWFPAKCEAKSFAYCVAKIRYLTIMQYKPDKTNVEYYGSRKDAIIAEIHNLEWWLEENGSNMDYETEKRSYDLLLNEMRLALAQS